MAEPADAAPPSEVPSGAADPLLLPEEILAQVFGYLTPQELGRLSLVSKVRTLQGPLGRALNPLLELEARGGG